MHRRPRRAAGGPLELLVQLGEREAGRDETVGGKPVVTPSRPALDDRVDRLPLGLHPAGVLQPGQDRVEGAARLGGARIRSNPYRSCAGSSRKAASTLVTANVIRTGSAMRGTLHRAEPLVYIGSSPTDPQPFQPGRTL